jgi:small subunit ribosomal protein S6
MANLLPGYETTFITRIDQTDDSFKALKEKIESIIQSFGGTLVYQEDWGKRRLAYPIEKEIRGQYTHFVYNGKPGVVAEIERNLRLHDSVMRFLTVVIAKEFDAEKYLKDTAQGTAMKRDERAGDKPAYERPRGEYGDRSNDRSFDRAPKNTETQA